jgi:hypothetical protein
VGILDSLLITGSVIVLYLVYFVYATVKNFQKMTADDPQDDIIQDNIRNQRTQSFMQRSRSRLSGTTRKESSRWRRAKGRLRRRRGRRK